MKNTFYTAAILALQWPIQVVAGHEIQSLKLELISHSAHAAVLAESSDERVVFGKFAELSCGLTEADVKQLKMPDWNSLRLKLSDIVSKSSSFFFKQMGVPFDPDSPGLLAPITGDDGRTITELSLQVPSVAAADIMSKFSTATERSEFITMHCAGLSKKELAQLSAPDWNHLQERLQAFLNEPADSFRVETPTSSQT